MSKVLLKDAPGYEAFVASCVKAASDMALAFVGEPDDKVRAHLEQGRENFTAKLARELGAETAAAIAEALIKAVLAQKTELEARGRGSA